MTVESRSIGHVHSTYRLPETQLDARERLDALLERVLDAALDGALARAGVARDEEVCIRSVATDARLRLASTDEALVADWSAALAAALTAAILTGEPGAVRYTSRRHALVDLAVATATADTRRAWAWRQLGLWPNEDAVDGIEASARLVDALSAEPQSVTAVLAATAQRGALPRLAVLIGTAGWVRLARAALAAAGASAELLNDTGIAHVDLDPAAEAEAAILARHLVSVSAIATAAIGSGAVAGLAPSARRAAAVLVALEADPCALTAVRGAPALVVVAAIAQELDVPPHRRHAGAQASGAKRAATDIRSVLANAAAASDPGHGDAQPERRPADADARVDANREADAGAPPEVRVRAWTGAGGLLFLLPLAAELEPQPGRTLRWTSHRLGLVLLPDLDEADPAALAFAGLGPDDRPPSDYGEPPTEQELNALGSVAGGVAAQLADLLERDLADDLVSAVCGRRAEIVAEPGWIEVRLDTAELDIDVRRAGLDLNPGWLPWLGVVVRFVYD
jgi:hypothetical protein